MGTVSMRLTQVPMSSSLSFRSPESTTMRTPGTVSEDSAMGVARITLRQPGGGGWSTSSCSAASNVL